MNAQQAKIFGNIAFARHAPRVPALDVDFMGGLAGVEVGGGVPLSAAWLAGWDEANLADKVHGWARDLQQTGLDVAGQRALEAKEPWRAKPVGFWDAVEAELARLDAEPLPAFWAFEDSGDAYDACQCDARIKTGALIVIESEKIVGLADTWPVAITAEVGKFHEAKNAGYFISMDGMGASAEQLAVAVAECEKRGWPLHPIFEGK